MKHDVVEMMMNMMDATADKNKFDALFDVMLELGIGEEEEPEKVAVKLVKLLPSIPVKVKELDLVPEYIKDKSRKDHVREDALHRTKNCGGKKKNRTREEYKKNRRDHMDRLCEQGIYIGDTVKNRRAIQKMDALERGADDNALAEQDILDYMRVVEAKKYYKILVESLTKECEALEGLQEKFSEFLKDAVRVDKDIVSYMPTVSIDSYAFEALEYAKYSLAEVTAELERYF